MTNAIFISEDYLKENTIINGNVDTKYLLANLKMVEDVNIQPILGTNLYNTFKNMVTSGSVIGYYKIALEEYIQPAMIYWLQTEMPVDMVFKWENKSIVKKNSDNSQPVDLNEIKFIIDKKDKIARFYSQRLINWLCANHQHIPEYVIQQTTDAMKPEKTLYSFGGMYLKKR